MPLTIRTTVCQRDRDEGPHVAEDVPREVGDRGKAGQERSQQQEVGDTEIQDEVLGQEDVPDDASRRHPRLMPRSRRRLRTRRSSGGDRHRTLPSPSGWLVAIATQRFLQESRSTGHIPASATHEPEPPRAVRRPHRPADQVAVSCWAAPVSAARHVRSDARPCWPAWRETGLLDPLVRLGVARVHRVNEPVERQFGLHEEVLDGRGIDVSGLHQLAGAVVAVDAAHDDVPRVTDRLPAADGIEHGLDLRVEEVRRGEQQVDVRILRDGILEACSTGLGGPVGLDLNRLLEQLRMGVDHIVEPCASLDCIRDPRGRRP